MLTQQNYETSFWWQTCGLIHLRPTGEYFSYRPWNICFKAEISSLTSIAKLWDTLFFEAIDSSHIGVPVVLYHVNTCMS